MFSNYTAILDACVLYPAHLRDLLLSLAGTGLFRARWTDQIHDEWIKAVLENNASATPDKMARTRALMNRAVPDCLVTGYESIVNGLVLPDPDDRHVLAAAIRAGADAIVTLNLKDFPEAILSRFGIEALHPDDFVLYQIDLNPDAALTAIREQRSRLRKPAMTPDAFLDLLESVVPRTVALLKNHRNRI